MRRLTIAGLVLAALAPAPATGATAAPARALIERSIAHHDPAGVWWSATRAITLRQPRAEGAEQHTTFVLSPDAREFRLRVEEGTLAAAAHLSGDTCTVAFAFDVDASRQRFKNLDCDRLRLYRAYYGYLFNAPMNLLDPAGTVEPDVIETEFVGRKVLAIRVTYGNGEPAWEHYFDPATAALVGCRFARDPEWKTGEYIVCSGEIESSGVRLPRERVWHYNANDEWLGSDVIEALDVDPAIVAPDPGE